MIESIRMAKSNFYMISIFLSGFLKIMTIDSRAALILEMEHMVVIEELVIECPASTDCPSLFVADGVSFPPVYELGPVS